MRVKDFHQTVDVWLKGLEPYDFVELTAQPAPRSWSLGQVYMHVLDETDFYFNQIRVCLASNDHAMEESTQEAKLMFRNNAFPDLLIVGPPSNALVRQPQSKQILADRLVRLKSLIDETDKLITGSLLQGKAFHPGLRYLSAQEWFQFAEMHCRHHLRQKARIEAFLERTFGR